MPNIQILKGTDSIAQDRIKINNNFSLLSLSIDDILTDVSTLQAGVVKVEPGKLLVGQIGDVGESKQVGGVVAMDFEGSFSYNAGTISHIGLTDIGSNTHAQIDTHISSTSNPHSVTATQVGNTTSQWNANSIEGNITNLGTLGATENGYAMVWDNGTSRIVPTLISGGGGADTNIANTDLVFDADHNVNLNLNKWTLYGDNVLSTEKRIEIYRNANNIILDVYNKFNTKEISLNSKWDGAVSGGCVYVSSRLEVGNKNDMVAQLGGGNASSLKWSDQWNSPFSQLGKLVDHYFLAQGFTNGLIFVVGSDTVLANERISLQGDTIISGEFVHHISTTATVDANLIDNSLSFHMVGTTLAGQYKDNLGLVTPLSIGDANLGNANQLLIGARTVDMGTNILVFTNGSIEINKNADVGTDISYGTIGGAVPSWASLSHNTHNTSTNFGFAQGSDGTTHINSPEKILFKQDGIEYARFTDILTSFYGATAIANEKISLQDDTLIKGSFEVVDSANAKKFEVRNNGDLYTNETQGWTGTYLIANGDTVTVTNGLITNVAP